jgi:hypothetical protein
MRCEGDVYLHPSTRKLRWRSVDRPWSHQNREKVSQSKANFHFGRTEQTRYYTMANHHQLEHYFLRSNWGRRLLVAAIFQDLYGVHIALRWAVDKVHGLPTRRGITMAVSSPVIHSLIVPYLNRVASSMSSHSRPCQATKTQTGACGNGILVENRLLPCAEPLSCVDARHRMQCCEAGNWAHDKETTYCYVDL